jgi:hypothetical protein
MIKIMKAEAGKQIESWKDEYGKTGKEMNLIR